MPGRIDDVSETSTRAGLRVVHVTDPADDRLADYNRLTDVALRSKHEPEKGLYIAESSTVIRRALAAGHRPRSFLMAERWLDDLADDIAALPVDDAPGGTGEQVPVYVGAPDVLEAITGFHLHRGALAAMHRPPLVPVRDLLSAARGGTGARCVAVPEDVVDHSNVGSHLKCGIDDGGADDLPQPSGVESSSADIKAERAGQLWDVGVSRAPGVDEAQPIHVTKHWDADLPERIVVLEDVADHTNVGAAMRACAAMGVGAVLITPSCADPLYRRSIRVSMGAVFQVPWSRFEHWPRGPRGGAPDGVDLLHGLGYTVAALALDDDSVSLDELAGNPPERLAMVFGTEGDGLKRRTVVACDVTVRIPMAGGVDSLNVASAVAVATWATRRVGGRP
ncbi:SpoU rRNA Methylase family protein [Cellulosimicrobium cellulans]|nr:SpoU rRNA Methylase family protein [Cellulosimicrobium cellulans]